jgi:flagella basal body P-ring formation protein FlgA
MACLLFLVQQPCGAAEVWLDAAQSALLDALRCEHPDVQQWDLEARVSERQRERLRDAVPLNVQVTATGARSAVRIEWLADGRRARTTVWFAASGMAPALVVRRAVRAGEPLQPGDAVLAEHDVMTLGCEPLTVAEALLGTRTRVPLSASEAICAGAVEPRPAVSRGEEVVVRFVAGRVAVSGRAIALTDGIVGSQLKVRNPSSGMTFMAEVVGEQEVFAHE